MTERPARPGSLPARWFAEMAERSGVIFFVLRAAPDVAYEYVSEAIVDKVGVTAQQVLADADSLHGLLDPSCRDALAGALASEPGREFSLELKWRHADGSRSLYSRAWMRARRRPDGSMILEGTVSEITELAAIEGGAQPPVFRGEHEYYRKDGSIMTGELQVIPHIDADGKVWRSSASPAMSANARC